MPGYCDRVPMVDAPRTPFVERCYTIEAMELGPFRRGQRVPESLLARVADPHYLCGVGRVSRTDRVTNMTDAEIDAALAKLTGRAAAPPAAAEPVDPIEALRERVRKLEARG